jgi:hypothetical protein
MLCFFFTNDKFVICFSTLVYWEYLSHGDSRVVFYVFLIFMLLSQLSWALTWPLGVRKLGSRKEEMLLSWMGSPLKALPSTIQGFCRSAAWARGAWQGKGSLHGAAKRAKNKQQATA